jgi:hypothetical protein
LGFLTDAVSLSKLFAANSPPEFMYIATHLYGMPQNSSYVIGALVASILLFTIGYLSYGSMLGHPRLQVFGGLLLGMLSMSVAMRVYGMP